jgi:fused signal recognition particle receptor
MSIVDLFYKPKNQLAVNKFNLSSSIREIFTHKKLDENFLNELEEALIATDVGCETSRKIIANFSAKKFDKNLSEEELKKFLAKEIESILTPCKQRLELGLKKPETMIFVGVNGSGKTTTIGKIAHNLSSQGKKVLISACDSFRSAAVEQLKIWADRSSSQIISALKEGEDPASIAYRSVLFAKENNFDVALIDTAGRLSNKKNLMDELKKITSVIKKVDENISPKKILVLDATTGQNAKNQLSAFDEAIFIDGIIITKLDGTARGGVVVALADKFKKSIYAIGVGEKVDDLQEFEPFQFTNSLLQIK